MYRHEAEKLRSFAERIQNLETEKSGLQDDIKDIFEDAKLNGFDPKLLKAAIKASKYSASFRQAERDQLDLYLSAIDGQHDIFEAQPEIEEVGAGADAIKVKRGLRRKAAEPAELH